MIKKWKPEGKTAKECMKASFASDLKLDLKANQLAPLKAVKHGAMVRVLQCSH